MTNSTRPSRLSHLAPATGMGNGSDNTQQPLETTFSSSAWPGLTNGAWSSNGIGSFNRGREAAAPRDSSNGFPNVPFGSSAFTSTSEADTWTNRAGLWNSADTTQARSLSGSTSPRSRSDASVNELNGNSTYYTSTQRAPARSKPQTALRPPSGGFGYASSFPDYPDERESVGSAEPRLGSYPVTQRSSQESSFLNAVGSGPSRDPGIPPANHAEPDIFGQTSSYAGYNYGGSTTASTHSQRPSIAGPSVAFPSANSVRYDSGGAQQMTHDEIIERLGRMGMDSDLNGASGSLSNDSPYRNGSLGFRFNPGSQSWGNEQVHQPSFARDMYPNDAGLENRASVMDRGSPAGSIYRAGGGSLNSPSFTGTPQPNPDAWSRPASRDPRMGPEVDRRGLSPPYVQQQHISYYPAPYYTQNYHGQFQQSFDPYTNIRLNGAMSGYNIPMPYPLGALGAGAVPHRPARDQDPGRGVRSVLLEEFKSNTRSNRRYELKEIYGHVVEFSGDQHGSRFIQQKLETANSDEKDQVFREIEPNALQLMKDVFGNYVIQKFFEHGNMVQKKILANAMKGKVVDLSTQMYACRVVQKALEHVLCEQQAELAKELEPDILKVIKDQNGNHVVQQVIALVDRQSISFVMDCFKGRVSELASHTYACRVVQRVLEHGTEADREAIMNELHGCAQMLVTDQYGNYVTQHVIEKGMPEDRSRMISLVTDQVMMLSKHKFASNVVEACITHGTPEEQRAIRDKLTDSGDDAALILVMKDQFGNYVIQKLLKTLQGQDRVVFVDKLRPHIPALRRAGATGKQISTIDNLISAVSTPTDGTEDVTPVSSAPTSPLLRLDVNSAAATPNLTISPNSPLSSPSTSPPSTNAGAAEEVADSKGKGKAHVYQPQPNDLD